MMTNRVYEGIYNRLINPGHHLSSNTSEKASIESGNLQSDDEQSI